MPSVDWEITGVDIAVRRKIKAWAAKNGWTIAEALAHLAETITL